MDFRFISPLARQVGNEKNSCGELTEVFQLKNEDFTVQIELELNEETFLTLNKNTSLPWYGIKNLIRLEAEGEGFISKISFEGEVLDDDGLMKKDRVLKKEESILSEGYHNLLIDLKGTSAGEHEVRINAYRRNGFSDEELILSKSIKIRISELEMPSQKTFYLDLWQHLTSLARYYNVENFSDEHFEIIGKFLEPLEKANQKVCDLIVSDYSWAGQWCMDEVINQSSLFEYNIIKVTRSGGRILTDFTAFDRYIELFRKNNMLGEINLFGILVNWGREDFTSPMENYGDPIRIRVYDEDRKVNAYIRTREELSTYIKSIFDHLDEMGLMEITRVMGDHPKDIEKANEYEEFIKSLHPKVRIKYAIYLNDFINSYEGDVDSFSLNSRILMDNFSNKESLLYKNREKMTWYTCWFPNNLNQFIKSPLMESRLVGYITYIFDLKGFLRWNYCLYTENPDSDVRYKSHKWAAGDMFFVYPGKNESPEYSLRMLEMIHGINDFNFFKFIEKKVPGEKIKEALKEILPAPEEIEYNPSDDTISINYRDDYSLICNIKEKLAGMYLERQ